MKITVSFFRHLFLLLFIVALTLVAQQQTDYASLIHQGLQLQKQHKYDEAKKLFRQAVKLNKEKKRAYFALARLNMEQHKWPLSKPWLDKVLDKSPENKEARYLMAICYREDALNRDQITRRILQHNARKHFETVVSQDSSYKNVLYEYSLLYRNEYEFEQAIDLCLAQLRRKPFLQEARYLIFRLYDSFLYHGGESALNVFKNTDDYQINWLKKRRSDYDRYFLGEKYRRIGKLASADSIFTALLAKPLHFSKTPIRLSQVRLYYQMGQPKKAEAKYWEAIDNLHSVFEQRFIFDDTKFIMSDQDLRVSFRSIQQIKDFYHRFWERKNPLNSLDINLRMAEHYRRLIYAEKEYIYDGIRHALYNPDLLGVLHLPEAFKLNHKFNHKGLIYIRYGEPDDIIRQTEMGMAANESWLYKATDYNPRIVFHFEIARHAPPADWQLVPLPTDPRMLESRLGWDKDLDRYYMAKDALDQTAIRHELETKAAKVTSAALQKERSTWTHKRDIIPLKIKVANFYGPDFENNFQIFLAVSAKSFKAKHENKNRQFHLQFGIAVYDSGWHKIYKTIKLRTLTMAQLTDSGSSAAAYWFRFKTPLNQCYAAAHVKDLDSKRIGGKKFRIRYKSAPQNRLAISDLLPAYAIEPTGGKGPFTLHGLQILPSVDNDFTKDKPLHLYFEIYNLQLVQNQSRYRIKQTVEPLKKSGGFLSGLFGGKAQSAISITKDQQGASAVSYEYSAFDFSSLNSGDYRLTIDVEDLNSGAKASGETVLHLK